MDWEEWVIAHGGPSEYVPGYPYDEFGASASLQSGGSQMVTTCKNFAPTNCPFCNSTNVEPWMGEVWNCPDCHSYIEEEDMNRVCNCSACVQCRV